MADVNQAVAQNSHNIGPCAPGWKSILASATSVSLAISNDWVSILNVENLSRNGQKITPVVLQVRPPDSDPALTLQQRKGTWEGPRRRVIVQRENHVGVK